MNDNDLIDSQSGSLGFGIANLAMTVNMLTVLTEKGVLSENDCHGIINRARRLLTASGGFPEDPDALGVAIEGIRLMEQIYHAGIAEMPKKGAN